MVNQLLLGMVEYIGLVLVIVGSNDMVVLLIVVIKLIVVSGSDVVRVVIIKGVDYIFNVLDENVNQDEQLLEMIIEWFVEVL